MKERKWIEIGDGIILKRKLLYNCNDCDWRGEKHDLQWTPFNPIDEFNGVDYRERNKYTTFKRVCPSCGKDDVVSDPIKLA